MNNKRYAHGFKRTTRQFGTMSRSRGWQGRALNMRKIDTAFLNNRAVGQYPRAATAAFGSSPSIFDKYSGTIRFLKRGTDSVLQLQQIGFYRQFIRYLCHRMP